MIHPNLRFEMGIKCTLDKNAYIGHKENNKGSLILGNKVRIGHLTLIRTCGGNIRVGNNTVINYNCVIHGMGGIEIGNNTLLSPCVQIYAQNHGIKKGELIMNQKQTGKGIKIGDDTWLGAGSVILDGVTIGKGAVIGANAVVTKNIPAYEIWVGNPAKKIGERK